MGGYSKAVEVCVSVSSAPLGGMKDRRSACNWEITGSLPATPRDEVLHATAVCSP